MYFDNYENLNDPKSTYKKLTLKHHPDCGGSIHIMQAINAEYDKVFAILKKRQNAEAANPKSKKTATIAPPPPRSSKTSSRFF